MAQAPTTTIKITADTSRAEEQLEQLSEDAIAAVDRVRRSVKKLRNVVRDANAELARFEDFDRELARRGIKLVLVEEDNHGPSGAKE